MDPPVAANNVLNNKRDPNQKQTLHSINENISRVKSATSKQSLAPQQLIAGLVSIRQTKGLE